MIDRFRVGVITTPHGVRGEVKVSPTTDEPERFKKLKEIILDTGKGERILKIRSVRVGGKFVILGFEGFDTVESVTPLRGAELYVDRKDAIPLKKGAETDTLEAELNRILSEARKDGRLAALSEKYFGVDLTKPLE